MTNLDSISKSRDITLPTKVRLVKAMVFPVVMYGCESWTVKKAECQRIDTFELWCWRRLLRVPWTARRSNQRADFGATWLACHSASPLTSLVNSGKFPDLSVPDFLTYTMSAYNIFQVFKTNSGRRA